jgi:hypothetical protein
MTPDTRPTWREALPLRAPLASARGATPPIGRPRAQVAEEDRRHIAELSAGNDAIAIRIYLPKEAVALPVEFLPADHAIPIEVQPRERSIDAVRLLGRRELLDLSSGEHPGGTGVVSGKAGCAHSHELPSRDLPIAIEVVLLPRFLRLSPIASGRSPASPLPARRTAPAVSVSRIGRAARAQEDQDGQKEPQSE